MVPTGLKTVVIGKGRTPHYSGSFRAAISLALLVAVLSLTQSAAAGAQTKVVKRSSVTTMTRYEEQLATAINTTRERHGLRTLRLVPGLMRSAGKHSLQMACEGYFAHSSPNGASFFARVKSYYGGNSSYFSAGENLLWAQPRATPRQVVKRWLASPSHRQVMLSPQWRVFGIGAVSSTHGAGVFAGRRVLLVTADFAVVR
jgi:uncharacterized protein YkwD